MKQAKTTKQPLEDSKEGLHTQGEWVVHSTGSLPHKFEIHPSWDEAGEHPIADIHLMEGQTIEECEANAELIVKAVNERKALLNLINECNSVLTKCEYWIDGSKHIQEEITHLKFKIKNLNQ